MTPRTAACGLLVLAQGLTALVDSASGQGLVPALPSCATCTIRLERLVSFGDEAGDGWVDITGRMALVGDEVVVVNLTAAHELRVFERDGTFRRRVGRRGAGPGEYGRIHDISVSEEGLLHVLDRERARLTILSANLTVEKILPLSVRPLGGGLLVLDDGSFVINAMVPTADRIGFPLHRFDADARLVTSYPVSSTEVHPGLEREHLRRIAPTKGGGSFWSVLANGYRVDRYDVDGPLLESFVVEAPWDVEGEALPGPMAPPPPPGSVMSVEEREGLLWVVSRRAARDFSSALSRESGLHGLGWRIDEYGRYFESVVDVIDPRSRRLVARVVHPGYLLRFVAPGLVVGYDDSQVTPRLVLYRVELEGLGG